MATYYFLNTGNQNWNNGANWSLSDGGTPGAPSAFPTSSDDAYFTSNSGNCTVSSSSACANLVCSGVGSGNYSGTLTLSNALAVHGNTVLSATMTLTNTASNYLQIGGGGFATITVISCTTNGLAINVPVRCAAPSATTTTFTDNVIFNGTVWFIGGGNTACTSSFSAGATFNNTVTIGNTGGNYIQSNYNIAGNTTLQAKGNVIFGGAGLANNGFAGTTLFLINGTGPQTISWTNTSGGATPPFVYGDITFNNSQITITMPSLKYSNATPGVDSTLTALTTVNANACTLTLVNRAVNTRIACGLISGSNRWGGLSVTVGTGGSYTPTFLEDFYCVDFVCGSSLNVTAGTAGGKNIYVSGNWTGSGGSNFDVGTASPCTVHLNGTGTQTWSATGYNGMSVVINNPNVVISGQIYKATCTITALTTASFGGSPQVLNLSGNVTLNTSLITWPGVNYVANGGTLTLLSDLNCVNFASANTNSFSGLYNINVSGNCTISNTASSNANIRMIGTGFIQINGIWNTNSSVGGIIIDSPGGTVTLQGTPNIRWGFFQYVQGSVVFSSLWTFGAFSSNTNVTIETNGLEWQGPLAFTGVVTATFTTPFRYRGTSLTLGSTAQTVTLNGEAIYTSNLTVAASSSVITGTSKIIFDGTGTISSAQVTGFVANNMDIDTSGTVDFTGDFRYSTGTLTYKAGKIRQNGRTLFFTSGACTVNGFNKVPLENVIIGPSGALSITMDGFFRGMPGKPCKIRSTATAANFAIIFSNGFEKLTSHVVIERCSILNGNLLVLTDHSINMHSGITINSPAIIASGNIGVRFINHSPNGVGNGLNYPPIRRYDLSGDYLVADPVYS